MKRILSLVLLLTLLCTLFACGKKNPDNTPDNGNETPDNGTTTYELGIGMVVENTASTNSSAEATVAAVITDANGKIIACRLDAIQMKNLFKDGAVDTTKTFSTKVELGDAYNMVTYGGAAAEWYVQAKTFETFVTGKTLSEVTAITTNDEGKTEQIAGCTIIVTGFIEAITKACNDTCAVTFEAAKAPTLGVSIAGAISDKSNAEAELVKLEATMDAAAVAMVDGKVVAATLDCAAPSFTYVEDANTVSFTATKRELGDAYNMVTYGGAIAEWYVQAQTFANTTVGKTAAEVAEITIEGVAGCTIYAGSFKTALTKAANAAR